MIKTVGIIPILDRRDGGIFQYSQAMLEALIPLVEEGLVQRVVVFCQPEFRENLPAGPWRVCALEPPSLWRSCKKWLKQAWPFAKPLAHQWAAEPSISRQPHINLGMRRWFVRQDVDFMIYPSPMAASFEVGIPFMMSIHDLQHRLQSHLPEFQNGVFEEREFVFRNGAVQATKILVDSEVGSEDMMACYGQDGVQLDQIEVLPFIPAPYLHPCSAQEQKEVERKYQLPSRYLFYPAQLWPHKQHHILVEALAYLKTHYGLEVPLVLCGSHSGKIRETYYHQVIDKAHELHVIDQIFTLGYVPDADMAALYQGADALVMPTLFGPTNIPVLEAWKLECLVITSDLRGIREQVGNAGILVNPHDAVAWAEVIAQMWKNPEAYEQIKHAGKRCLSSYTNADFQAKVRAILTDVIEEEGGGYVQHSARP